MTDSLHERKTMRDFVNRERTPLASTEHNPFKVRSAEYIFYLTK